MTPPLKMIDKCVNEDGSVRKCRKCPHIGNSRFNGLACDAVMFVGGQEAIKAFNEAIADKKDEDLSSRGLYI